MSSTGPTQASSQASTSVQAQIRVLTIDSRTITAEASVVDSTVAERIKQAGRWLAMMWLAAVVSIAVPILHFILVPGFLILGIVVFANVYAQSKTIASLKLTCPACTQLFEFKNVRFKSAARELRKDLCPHCRAQIRVSFE